MGLNPDTTPDPDDAADGGTARRDDLAAYALDALDEPEALTVDAWMATDLDAARLEGLLRNAGATFGASGTVHVDTPAPPDLRARVLTAAHALRRPGPVEAADVVEVHRIELDRLVALLRGLTDEQWGLPLDPPEFAGWTIHDLAAHLAANEGLAVQVFGLTEPALPEQTNDNETRTVEVQARHRTLSPARTVDELEACGRAVDTAALALGPDGLDLEIDWWGMPMRRRTVLAVRAFETWTHADDIRRAIGAAPVAPPASSLAAMSQIATGWTALMLAAVGREQPGRSVELRLTGAAQARFHVPTGLGADGTTDLIDLTGTTPDAVITLDMVDYCRAIGDRYPTGPLRYEASGDLDLAQVVVAHANALATL